MNFADAVREQNKFTKTENGAVALKSSGSKCLDFFATVGSLRSAEQLRKETLFEEAYKECPIVAIKTLFYARDILYGLGERETFRTLLHYAAFHHPEAIRPNIDLIGGYGRYDDLYSLIGTPLEDDMWDVMKKQLEEDLRNYNNGESVSLLAKWIKTADASSDKTRRLGILTAQKLGYPVYNFKRMIRALRKHIGVVESLMSTGRWDEIKYSEVPSRAMMIYRDAFKKHDEARYTEFIGKALTGKEKINASTLYPYDLIEKIMEFSWDVNIHSDPTVEAQWKQLPDYVEKGTNAIVIADTSGSMYGRPMASAVGLAVYFAERNVGAYHNMWMTFSEEPQMQILRGKTLSQKLKSMSTRLWGSNTDLKAAFDLVLSIAIKNNVPPEEMPKSLIVISDMEIDQCGNRKWTFYENMQNKFRRNGYEIPNIVFWNVNSRHDVFHADSKRRGVQLVSGQSTTTFKNLLSCIGMTPTEAMMKVIGSDRYEPIRIGE